MRHTPVWAALALYPLVATVVGATVPVSATFAALWSGWWPEFLDEYWWLLVGAPAVVATVFFLAHALASHERLGVRRFAWAAGMLLVGPLVVPAYWWFCSDAAS